LSWNHKPVILACKNNWLLCITAVGIYSVWDVKSLSSPHPPVSLALLLDAAIHTLTIHPTAATLPFSTNARLNSEGRIIISLSNGDGYAYSSLRLAPMAPFAYMCAGRHRDLQRVTVPYAQLLGMDSEADQQDMMITNVGIPF
jgi:protein HIRA/HIR1